MVLVEVESMVLVRCRRLRMDIRRLATLAGFIMGGESWLACVFHEIAR